MSKKSLFFLAFAILLALSFSASTKSYDITSADLNYKINADGTVDARQEISYYFSSGTFSELYIQLPPDLQITGASGSCTGKKCTFKTQMNQGWRELVLAGTFTSGNHETVVFEYKIQGEVLAQKDTAQFFFQLWGDQWQKSADTLTATVEFPGSEGLTQRFIHPYYLTYETAAQASSTKITSNNHPPGTYLEINALMPREWFSDLPQAKNYMSKQDIIDGENKEMEAEKLKQQAGFFISLVMLAVVPLTVAACYFMMGRETPLEQLGYQAVYEHEPPGTLSPTAAAKIIGKGSNGDYIAAEMLNLVQMKFISLEQATAKGGFLGMGEEKVVVMRLLKLQDEATSLEPHQRVILSFLYQIAENGAVTSKKLAQVSSQRTYLTAFQRIEEALSKSFDRGKYLDAKGNTIVCLVSFAALVLSFFVLLQFFRQPVFFIAVCVESFAAIALVVARPTLIGKWNDEGRVMEAKWQNFYKFLNDMTLMREKAPADIVLWERYLVYATAFGISSKVTEAVKAKFPDAHQLNNSQMYSNLYLAGALHGSVSSMSGSFHSMSSHSGGGGFGGGHGGGGGGGGAR